MFTKPGIHAGLVENMPIKETELYHGLYTEQLSDPKKWNF